MIRDIITIDEDKCTGCGLCIPNCPEGALRIVDGKARLVSDQLCDGLGACLGECPEDAILVEQRDADGYDEETVLKNVLTQGEAAVDAHLKHLEAHGEDEYLRIAKTTLQREEKLKTEVTADLGAIKPDRDAQPQWPVQLHLVMPTAPVFQGSDVVIAADCTAYAASDFYSRHVAGRPFAIACPKLDSNLEEYRAKITSMIDDADVTSITVVIMQVPCCRGLLALTTQALELANRSVPVKVITLDIKGEVLSEEQIA